MTPIARLSYATKVETRKEAENTILRLLMFKRKSSAKSRIFNTRGLREKPKNDSGVLVQRDGDTEEAGRSRQPGDHQPAAAHRPVQLQHGRRPQSQLVAHGRPHDGARLLQRRRRRPGPEGLRLGSLGPRPAHDRQETALLCPGNANRYINPRPPNEDVRKQNNLFQRIFPVQYCHKKSPL